MKRLYVVEYGVRTYFWAEEGKEQEAAEEAFREEADNVWLDGPEYLQAVDRDTGPWQANFLDSIPWGEAPDGFDDLTLSEIRERFKVQS